MTELNLNDTNNQQISQAENNQKPAEKKQSLTELLAERLELMDELAELGGDVTDNPLEDLWNTNAMALADKIDNYGRLIKHLESKKEALTAEINSVRVSLQKKVDAIENNIDRIKKRMFDNCPVEGEKKQPLRGNIYSFLPRVATKKTVPDIEKVEEKHRRITYDIKGEDLLAALKTVKLTRKKFESLVLKDEKASVKERALLADLPAQKNGELHKAIVVEYSNTTTLR